MLISKKKLRIWLGIFLISLFCFTNGLHSYLYGSENIALMTLVLGGFLVWSGRLKFAKQPIFLFVLLLLLIMLFNNQDNAEYGTVFVFNTLYYLILWFIFCVLCENNDWHNAFIKIVLAFGIFHALCTWFFYFTPSFYIGEIAPLFETTVGNLINQYNHGWMPGLSPSYSTNGVYLGMTSCIILGVFLTRRKKNIMLIVGTFLLITALLLTGKRSQTLALILAFLILYYFYNTDKKKSRLFKIVAIVIAAICAFYIIAQLIPSLGNFVTRFEEGIASGDVTEGRSDRFAQAGMLFLQHPIFGIGWNGSNYYFESLEGIVINVHNIYIQLLAETGIIGGIAYFLFFIYNIYWAIKLLVLHRTGKVQSSKSVTRLLCCAVALEVFFLFYGITGNPLYDYQSLFPYLGACAIVQYYKTNMVKVNKGEDIDFCEVV